MERINLVELLKDCIGMELDCVIFDDVTLYRIDTSSENEYPIRIETKSGNFLDLTKYGTYSNIEESKCVIFPKGKTTWEGFVPPCQFKDGDVITCTNSVCTFTSIFKEKRTPGALFIRYCTLILDKNELKVGIFSSDFKNPRLATKKEKQKLFRAIKDNGYRWNPETKTLKLIKPEFHENDWVIKGGTIAQILDIQEQRYVGLDINGKEFILSRSLKGDKIHLWTINDAKDGDVLASHGCLVLFKKLDGHNIKCYCTYHFMNNPRRLYIDTLQNKNIFHPATEEEKQELFDAIKAKGYKWNAETKTLEKLIEPEFKDGDIVTYKYENGLVSMILNKFVNFVEVHHHCALYDNAKGLVTNNYIVGEPKYIRLATKEEKEKLFQAIKDKGYKWNEETKTLEKLVKSKFKVGDKVRHKTTNKNDIYEISKVYDDSYGLVGFTWMIYMKYQDQYEIIPNKFDINTLVPFESRVLVRSECDNLWRPAIFGFYLDNNYAPYYVVGGTCWEQCIPYEGNEHLRGKTDDCDEFFRTWEKTGN